MCNICRQTPCAAGCPNNDEEPIVECSICGRGIYDGDDYYELGGVIYCESCTYDNRHSAYRDNGYCSGKPVFSYGDKWED